MPNVPSNHKPEKEPTHKKCPKFEDAAAIYLENIKERERAMQFAAWLRSHKMSPSPGNSGYNWYVSQNKKRVFHLKMADDTWFILTRWEIIDELISDEKLKDVVLKNAAECIACVSNCAWGMRDLDIYGQKMTICRQYFLVIRSPDSGTIELFKNFLLTRNNS
jgi:hypothetical protein